MRSRIIIGVVVTAALAGGFWLGQTQRESATPPETGAVVLQTPRDPGAFELVDHHGAAFTPERLAGGWTLWFFGFTNCPDICPMTLVTLDLVDAALAEAGATRPQVLMMSVDPARDTPERLAAYVPYFNPGFVGVTGSMGEVRQLTERLGIIVQYTAGEGDNYTVDHSSQLMLTGPDGLVHAVFPSPHDPGSLARDLALLLPWLERQL